MDYKSLIEKIQLKGGEDKMRKLFSIILVAMLALSVPAQVFAAFDAVDKETFNASTTTTGAPGVHDFSATLGLVATPDTPISGGVVSWTDADAGAGWKTADQCIKVTGYGTYRDGWGIQVYTDNTNMSGPTPANPQYLGSGDPAGLVENTVATTTLPMCWRVRAADAIDAGTVLGQQQLQILEGEIDVGGDDVMVLYDGVPGHEPGGSDGGDDDYFPWFFMLDKETPDVDPILTGDQVFGNYQIDATFLGIGLPEARGSGLHHAPGNVAANWVGYDNDDAYYIYLGADFGTAAAGATYSTNKITVEIYHL